VYNSRLTNILCSLVAAGFVGLVIVMAHTQTTRPVTPDPCRHGEIVGPPACIKHVQFVGKTGNIERLRCNGETEILRGEEAARFVFCGV